MISRRSILKWLGFAPVAIAVAKVAPAQAMGSLDTAYAPTRVRAWKSVLEPDGSSSFVKDGERWLDSWVKTQKEEDWGKSVCGRWIELDDIKAAIQTDVEAMNERCEHWRHFQAFQKENGIEVEAIFTGPGRNATE